MPSVTRITSIIDKSAALMGWAINNTLDVCKGAIAPGTEYAEVYLDAVWAAAKKASQRIKQEAADKGHESHRIIEQSLGSLGTGGEKLGGVVGDWLQSCALKPIATERRIYSRRHCFSGTLDCLAEKQSGLVLIDWKTGKSIYPEFRLQTAAYVAAYEEEFPDQKIEGRYIVKIGDEGIEPHYYPRDTYRKDLAAFLGAKKLFDRVQQIEKENRKSL